MKVFTIGHSTRSFDDFRETLSQYGIDMIVDIRKLPSSTKFPQFDRKYLEKELPSHGISYVHFPDLGGFRRGGYAAYAQTPEFKEAVRKFLTIVKGKHAAVMCAEILWYRCHRRYVATELVNQGFPVVHIYNKQKTQDHKASDPEIAEKMQLTISCDDSLDAKEELEESLQNL